MQPSNNSLLPPTEPEDFQKTGVYQALRESKEAQEKVLQFLSADDLDDLEFVVSPKSGAYAPYDREDFAEITAYIRYNGTQTGGANSGLFRFRFFDTPVGKFVVCYCGKSHTAAGILSRRLG